MELSARNDSRTLCYSLKCCHIASVLCVEKKTPAKSGGIPNPEFGVYIFKKHANQVPRWVAEWCSGPLIDSIVGTPTMMCDKGPSHCDHL